MSRFSRVLRFLICLAAWLTVLALLAAVIGQVARDRTPLLTRAFYLPLIPIGFTLALLDLALLGRSLGRRLRFVGTAAGLLAMLAHAYLLTGLRPAEPAPPGQRVVRVAQWNVRWGGGPLRTRDGTWRAFTHTLLDQRPDIVIFCEAPELDWIGDFLRAAGQDAGPPQDSYANPTLATGSLAGWHYVVRTSPPGNAYSHRTVICSRWPVELESAPELPNGAALVALVHRPDQVPIRLCAVDGVSLLHVPRTPMLQSLASLLTGLAASGNAPDIVTGDFNAPSRARGFDAVFTAGSTYRLASGHGKTWRGTYPARFPIYDIDHLLITPSWHVADAETFAHPPADHRGQVYSLWRD